MISKWQALWGAGRIAGKRGEKAKEEELLRQALRLGQQEAGPKSLELGILFLDLAECLEGQGKPEADEFYKQAQELIVTNARRLGMF